MLCINESKISQALFKMEVVLVTRNVKMRFLFTKTKFRPSLDLQSMTIFLKLF